MTRTRRLVAVIATAVATGTVLAAPAHADVDTEFAELLHTFGIYGQRDYNAWIAKLTCKRLRTGVDGDAFASARFIDLNLPRDTSTYQTWRFLATAIDFYCADQVTVLHRAASDGG